ncbi:hypothetical protein GIB67_025156, partial [Kingdonia uniflora]
RERQKIRGFDKELSEGDKRLKREKDSGSRRWLYSSIVRERFDATVDSHSDTEGVKSKVARKESLLNEVVEEEIELELVLEGLSLSKKKRVDSRSNKEGQTLGVPREKVAEGRFAAVDDLKEVEDRARLAVLDGEKDTSKMVARLVKGIWLGIEEKNELKKVNIELEKELAHSRTDALKEVRHLKASHAVAIGRLQVETKANFDEMVEERDRLEHHLMLKGYSEEKVDTIKADTYAEEDEEEAEVLGIVDGLDGISCQTAIREMSLRIKDLESGLARERKTSKVMLSAQEELQVELDSSRSREDDVLMCNREFAEQFDRMKEANENREDQYVKAHFKLVEERAGANETKMFKKDDELMVARENLSVSKTTAEHLQIALPTKDMKFWEIQRRCNNLNERVTRLKAELAHAIVRAKKAEAREYLGGSRTEGHVKKGNVNLRECQHKLDAAVIMEKVLKGEIKAKK